MRKSHHSYDSMVSFFPTELSTEPPK